MAKKPSPKPAPSEKTTTYSIRLNDQQRESLERATQHVGVSASRFMRDATLRAAADMENGASPNDRAISHLANRLADALLNQKVVIEYEDEHDEIHERVVLIGDKSTTLPYVDSIIPGQRCPPTGIRRNSLNENDIRLLAEVARVCPLTFSRSLIAALTGAGEPTPEFVSKADPDRLLND